jgi:hypothetical protein
MNISALGKIKAMFKFDPLTAGKDIPMQAVKCSARAMQFLLGLSCLVEEKRNESKQMRHLI